MITFSKLGDHGRLGNQLFQYALLRGVGAKTRLDIGFPENGHRLLDWFQVPHKFFGEIPSSRRVFREKRYHLDPDVFGVQDGTDFIGYYQTERYFEHIADQIRAELQPQMNYQHAQMRRLQECRSALGQGGAIVAIHMRRGDNVHGDGMDPAEHATFIPCQPLSYYRNAVEWIGERVPGPKLFVICTNTREDADWCREHFPMETAIYRGGPEDEPIHDLAFMMLADHLVVSNSTLSWWAGWLSERPGKFITYPTIWFGPAYADKNLRDLWPKRPNWNQVAST